MQVIEYSRQRAQGKKVRKKGNKGKEKRNKNSGEEIDVEIREKEVRLRK